MFSIVSTFIFISIGFKATLALAAKNGYVVADIIEKPPPCKDASKIIRRGDTCAGIVTYKMADFSGIPNAPDVSSIRAIIPTIDNTLKMVGANATCRNVYKKYFCQLGYPFHCDEKTIQANVDELTASCKGVGKQCSARLHQNCATVIDNPAFKRRYSRKGTCVPFPELKNDSYPCERNYKVFALDATSVQKAADMIVAQYKIVKNANLSDAECETKVADAVCKSAFLACSHDRTKIIAFLSKQECYKIVGCVNKTNDANLIQKAQDMCSGLPDGTKAKTYSLDNVYNKANNKATSLDFPFTAILFLATFIAQRFF
ncbi:uncharacterized protein LOC114522609 [Dendronephthya gigantea]|uniref:uncharacterized protein LOC114522609 n=1 Tax=Dendronephthya gigantea TaxID=151771 RepID=UPI001069CEDC|nr:uncharacterized protein LOC114522609 [Dendronephthya gigantea]